VKSARKKWDLYGGSECAPALHRGSDARVIMSLDAAALIRLWKEKCGEVEPMDLRDNLVLQLGIVTEALNRSWYEPTTGRSVTDSKRSVQHPVNRWTAGADRLPGYGDEASLWQASTRCAFSEEGAAEKLMAQLQHNIWVTNARSAALSIITGGGKWIEMTVPAEEQVDAGQNENATLQIR
jgi:hypothetical protein